jgi:hypothetical protein
MAYSDFTFTKLYSKFGIEQESKSLFSSIEIVSIEPTQHLLQDLEEAKETPLYAEKAKSEAIIFPIIKEIKRRNKHISIFSGYTFNVDASNDLTGAPDFMISMKPKIVEPQRPIFCLVESKNKTPEEGFAQCAAEMYAARLFNQQTGEQNHTIYGAVTNAFDWVFLKLEDNTVFIDLDRYYLNQLPILLGIFQAIVSENKK